MKLSEIPFDEIKIGQRVRSDNAGWHGAVHETYTRNDRRDCEDFFVVVHWDNANISNNWHFWMDQITVVDGE